MAHKNSKARKKIAVEITSLKNILQLTNTSHFPPAFMFPYNLGIVEMMVSSHPEIIEETDANGWTVLHYVSLRGNVKATRLLMQQDSSISYILDKSGMSALHVAAYAGRKKVMEVLTQFRPDTCELVNHKGQTVLHAAVLGGKSFTVKYILSTPKFAGLINEADNDGNTPLHLAAIQRDTSVLRPLARNPRVDKTAINNQLLKAADVFLGDDIELVRNIGAIAISF